MGACLAVGLVASSMAMLSSAPVQARGSDQTIRLKNVHTNETGVFNYKRNGRYDKGELARINHLLRDWRKNQSVNMDPQLLDMISSVYRETGASGYIQVVCGFRSPATNNMLRSRSRGVAQNSQHTLGKAIDFYIPGVPLAKLRATAMKIQGGGVGYYPTSGSPFVHMDTGNVRAWPRMSRTQLIALFPKGDTLHLPSDGKPLAGYERALAQRKSGKTTALAYLDTGERSPKSGGGWLKRVFSGGADQAEDDAESGVDTAVATAPPFRPQEPAAPLLPGVPSLPDIAPVPETVPGESVPAIAAPDAMLAEASAPQSRVPRARPISDAETAIALLSGAPAGPESVVPSEVAFASLAYAPLPRSRPDSGMLADSLGGDPRSPEPLSVGAEDAIAALAAQAGASLPEPARPEPSAASALASVSVPASQPMREDAGAAAASVMAYAPADIEPEPPTRRLAVASAGLGFEPADLDVDTTGVMPEPEAADPRLIAALAVKAAALRATLDSPVADTPIADEIAKTERIRLAARQFAAAHVGKPASPAEIGADAAASNSAAADGFAMPEPSGAPGLFAAPMTSSAIVDSAGEPRLPAGRFRLPQAPPAAGDESFLSRLFASLSQ